MKTSTQKFLGFVAVLALILSIVGLVGGNSSTAPGLGGTTNYDTISVNGFKVGAACNDTFSSSCVGTTISQILTGTCNLVGQGNIDTIAATGIATTSCAVTGVLSGDKVFALLGQSSTTIGAFPVVVQSAFASSTASGAITVVLYNATSSANQVTKVGTSTQYLIIR